MQRCGKVYISKEADSVTKVESILLVDLEPSESLLYRQFLLIQNEKCTVEYADKRKIQLNY